MMELSESFLQEPLRCFFKVLIFFHVRKFLDNLECIFYAIELLFLNK